ncbi:MAG: MFS transporter [Tissierellia bacterium]|nr:MFS transporter [Tissierellia bacterium]
MSKDRKDDIVSQKVAIPLSKKNKTLVTLASCLFMFYIAAHGTALAISQSFILTKINAMDFFSLSAILIALGAAITTPIGGKLGDIVGRRNLMVVSGIVAFISTVGIAYSPNVGIYLLLMIINSLSKGLFTAAPFILMNMINEQKDVPKANGLLASSIAAGTFGGAIIAGAFNDMNQTELGFVITGLFILLASVLIFISLPNQKSTNKVKIDIGGIALLTILISAFVLTFNFAPQKGWLNPIILAGFAVMIISFIAFVKFEKQVEAKNEDPIIAMSLFQNKEYRVLLMLGLAIGYYQVIMINYGSLASLKVLGESATITSFLILPRTAIVLILPAFAGIWVGKDKSNYWKAMAIATMIAAIAFVPLTFISKSMSIMVFFVCFTVTGITESLRAVSVTPAAQEILTPENLSSGTALVNFVNTLASVMGTTIAGVLYNAAGDNIVAGIRYIFISTVIITVIGFLLVIFFIRKYQNERYKNI